MTYSTDVVPSQVSAETRASAILHGRYSLGAMNLIDTARARRLPTPSEAKAIRIAANVTQAELAAEVGVHYVTIGRWESGRRRPRGDQAATYAAIIRTLAIYTEGKDTP